MGTRNLSLCKNNNEFIIRQYGQWDGYPSGQGATILSFCQSKENLQKLKDKLSRIVDIHSKFEDYANAFNYDIASPIDKRYIDIIISRDIGGKIFQNIVSLTAEETPAIFGNTIPVMHYSDFDKLQNFCDIWIEYAYIIDFDDNKLRCYGLGVHLKDYDLYDLPTEDNFIQELEAVIRGSTEES